MTDEDRAVDLLIGLVQAQSSDIRSLIGRVSSLESSVQHLEAQVRNDTRFTVKNSDDLARVNERHTVELQSTENSMAVRAQVLAFFSAVIAGASVLWNVFRGNGE